MQGNFFCMKQGEREARAVKGSAEKEFCVHGERGAQIKDFACSEVCDVCAVMAFGVAGLLDSCTVPRAGVRYPFFFPFGAFFPVWSRS
jgi:hypothetical protein